MNSEISPFSRFLLYHYVHIPYGYTSSSTSGVANARSGGWKHELTGRPGAEGQRVGFLV